MNGTWKRGDVRLAYRLGEVTLFSLKFDAIVCTRHFADMETEGLLSPPEDLSKVGGTQLVVTRSHPVTSALPTFSTKDGWLRYVPRQYKRYYVDLTGTFEDYLARFSSKTRSTLKRKVRKFSEASGGQIDLREYRSPHEVAGFFPVAIELSQRTYQDRLLDSGLPKDEEFMRHAVAAAADGGVRAYVLFLKGRAAAYLYCPIRAGVFSYDYVGFDPECQDLSPGTVLQYLVLQRLFEEGGHRMFDFTEGEGPHKALFATHHATCADLYFYRHTFANAAAVRLHSAVDRFSDGVVDVLDRLHVKAAIKKALRRAA